MVTQARNWLIVFMFLFHVHLIDNLSIHVKPGDYMSKQFGSIARTVKSFHEMPWSVWCKTQQNTKTCAPSIHNPRLSHKFYYDTEFGGCKTFLYGMCGNNPNQFETLDECYEQCGENEDNHDPEETVEMDYSTICLLQPEKGSCYGHHTMYYYNVDGKGCTSFIYGGCGGNLNRFHTIGECIENCKPELLKLSYEKASNERQNLFKPDPSKKDI